MLGSVKEMRGFAIAGTDGEVGTLEDVYFDDEKWTVRHLVVDTGTWLSGRKVLISPRSVSGSDRSAQTLRVGLTRGQIEGSASIDTDKPVSRQQESALDDYYGYPYYWAGPMLWGYTALPLVMTTPPAADPATREMRQRVEEERDHHLRSCNEVIGYHIRATDDEIGHVEDFLIDDADWSIDLIVIDTRNWWPGKHVLLSPRRIDSVSWEDRNVVVNISREALEGGPEYDPEHPPLRSEQAYAYRPADARPSRRG